MKIAILTLPLGHNYGGLLQAYALQQALSALGAEAIVIDRRKVKPSVIKRIKYSLKNSRKRIRGKIKNLPSQSKKKYILQNLLSFKEKYINSSEVIRTQKELLRYMKETPFDLFIVGSDQVWRPKYTPRIENYFLDFCSDLDISSKKISYAASFGVDSWEFTESQTETCKKLLREFDSVGVRENSAIGLCKEKFGINADFNVDPTLLLTPSNYTHLLPSSLPTNNKGRVLSYILDSTTEKEAISNEIAKALRTDCFLIKPKHDYVKVEPSLISDCQYPKVEQWLLSFYIAKFVVTDSFHGCIFSILFNKPFLAIGNTKRGLARFNTLLAQFDLTDRLITSHADFSLDLINTRIDWDTINRKRESLRETGLNYLAQFTSLE